MPVDLNKLSIAELEKLKKGYTKLYKTKLIDEIKKLRKETEKVKPKPKEPKMKKTKTFEQYFQECIQNKRIPPDTPLYLRKALERAMREHTQGIVREKSAFEDFANKYIIDGEPGLLPLEFFRRQKEYLKEFLKNHKNTKVRFVLICMMVKQEGNEKLLLNIPRGFTFPVKIRDITKFESLNPDIPGINVFSVNESKKFYPLRMALRDPHKTIDLFLYAPQVEEAGGLRGELLPRIIL